MIQIYDSVFQVFPHTYVIAKKKIQSLYHSWLIIILLVPVDLGTNAEEVGIFPDWFCGTNSGRYLLNFNPFEKQMN